MGVGNSIAFGSAPRREADSQPISPLVRQAVSQAVSWASRQADRYTKFGFFRLRTRLQATGSPPCSRTVSIRAVMQSFANQQVSGSISDRLLRSVLPEPRSNPSEHKLLTPPPRPPPPAPPPPKKLYLASGDRIKKSIGGGRFIGGNNDFTKSWTSNIMPRGMLRE